MHLRGNIGQGDQSGVRHVTAHSGGGMSTIRSAGARESLDGQGQCKFEQRTSLCYV